MANAPMCAPTIRIEELLSINCDSLAISSVPYSPLVRSLAPTSKSAGSVTNIPFLLSTVSFDLLNEEQLKVCFNYRNFQPLWSTRNSAKSDDFSLQDELLWVKHMKKLGFEGELFIKSGCLQGTRASVEIESTTAPVLAPALLSQEH